MGSKRVSHTSAAKHYLWFLRNNCDFESQIIELLKLPAGRNLGDNLTFYRWRNSYLERSRNCQMALQFNSEGRIRTCVSWLQNENFATIFHYGLLLLIIYNRLTTETFFVLWPARYVLKSSTELNILTLKMLIFSYSKL